MNLSKRTAERMLKNIDKQLQAYALEQQSLTEAKGNKMRKGGRVKMPWGDTVVSDAPELNINKPYKLNFPGAGYTYGQSWLNGIKGFGTDPYQADFGLKPLETPTFSQLSKYKDFSGPSVPTAVSDANLAAMKGTTPPQNIGYINEGLSKLNLGIKPPVNNTLAPNKMTTTPSLGSGVSQTGFGWNDALGLAPTAFNLIAGLTSGKADIINPNQYQNPYESQAFGLMPSQFRIDDMLNDNRNAYGNFLRNVNQTGNSRGERMANYSAGMNRMNEANTRAWALKNNQEAEMDTRKAMLRNAQGDRRAAINLNVRDMNDQNKAAARNRRMAYFGAAAEGAQRYGLTQKQMAGQLASQDAYVRALQGMPFMSEWTKLGDYFKNRV